MSCAIDKDCPWRCVSAEDHERAQELRTVPPPVLDLSYAEAKREARQLLGKHADVELVSGTKAPFFPARVGVWQGRQFLMVGAGQTLREALEDVRARRRDAEFDRRIGLDEHKLSPRARQNIVAMLQSPNPWAYERALVLAGLTEEEQEEVVHALDGYGMRDLIGAVKGEAESERLFAERKKK